MTTSTFDFSSPLHRWNTHSAKWDLLAAPFGPDAVSLSVADMEFRSAPAVIEAIEKMAALGAYGYTEVFDDFRCAAANWQRRRHGLKLEPDDLIFFPRIVQCVAALVNVILPARLRRRPHVLSFTPSYRPLLEVCEKAGADITLIELHDTAQKARIDFEACQEAMSNADLFLFTNPHNPSGRVWERHELEHITTIVRSSTALVLSDDIHADFTRLGGLPYIPLAALAPDLWESGRILHCASPGKTFNIAGLESSAIFTRGPIALELEEAKRQLGLHNPNYFAIPAAIAAWNSGDQWVDALTAQIDQNLREARSLLSSELPHATINNPEGTYLLWVDARAYATSAAHIDRACHRSRVLVTPGEDFGDAFVGFFRINTALALEPLLEALRRFARALAAESPPLHTPPPSGTPRRSCHPIESP